MLTETLRQDGHRNPRTRPTHVSFMPPFILEHMANSESYPPELRTAARRTLRYTKVFQRRADSLSAAKLRFPAPHLDRLVFSTRSGESDIRKEGQVASSNVSIDECYDGFGATFKLYYDIFMRNSIDDSGEQLVGHVRDSSPFNNALWDGCSMVFGEGDGHYFNRFTSLDIIGHELTHGIISYTCNLDYRGQSGALNESLADVFGSMVKQYHLKQTAVDADWLIGQGLFTAQVHGTALRSMKVPGTAYDDPTIGKDPQPSDMQNYVHTEDDWGGVHINSGIPNHAFYIIATALGGYSWERAGQIWYATVCDTRLPQNADFNLFAWLTVHNAVKLYGKYVGDLVASTWRRVGVEPSQAAAY